MLEQTACQVAFAGGEGQTVFPVPFPFLDSAHLAVAIRTGEAAPRPLAIGVDYAVNRQSDNTGEVVLVGSPLPAGDVLTIRRTVPLTQGIFFHNQGPNSPKASEEAFDKLTMIAQQQDAEMRTLGQGLAAKADAAEVARDLAEKASAVHTHAVEAITGLPARLAAKANLVHASSHHRGGTDRLPPDAIGAMPSAPSDGRNYLATGNGWVEYIPQGGGGGEAPADHAVLHNRDAPGQHPQSAIQYLERDLTELRDAVAAAESTLEHLEENAVPEAPSDGALYGRQDNAWTIIPTASGGGTPGAYPGEIRLLPYRAVELPSGWYFCNGDRFLLTSPQGQALNGLSELFKADWGIATADGAISLPSLFSGDAGYFLRPANNATRMPGSREDDAIRNITGSVLCQTGVTVGLITDHELLSGETTGAFVKGEATTAVPNMTSLPGHALAFDASEAVPTADENRPRNIAMTPAIYLGV